MVTGSTPHDGDARILIVDDHAIIAQSLSQTMAALGMVVQVAGDLSQDGVVGLAQRFQPHVVLLDLYLDRTESIPFIAPLTSGGAKVVMLTGSTNRGILGECVEAGAVAVIGKGHGLSVLVDAVRNALTGATLLEDYERGELLEAARSRRAAEADRMKPFDALTNREQQVLAALTESKTAEEIAEQEFVSLATVRSHIRAVLQKLGVNSQLAAVTVARRHEWPG
ncbi:MAG: response regulator transcription factor [Actinomycetota bacterium]|nr:response regulator transcription factor [Actinomycetota bacterium]